MALKKYVIPTICLVSFFYSFFIFTIQITCNLYHITIINMLDHPQKGHQTQMVFNGILPLYFSPYSLVLRKMTSTFVNQKQ